jgi:transcriptional regulator with XRE-family HTH domain
MLFVKHIAISVIEKQSVLSHIGYMKRPKQTANRIAQFRKARKMTQQQLADAIGSHWVTVSKMERGSMRLSDEWRVAIAKALGVDEWDLIVGARSLPTVHVEGTIEEGGEVLLLDEEDTSASFSLSTDYFTHPSYRWLLVSGDALWPWYQDGDRVCMWHISEDEIESVRGRLVILWFKPDGAEKEDLAIGVLERGKSLGLFTVNRFNAPPVRDIKPISLAVVAMAIYYVGENIEEPAGLVPPSDLRPV